MLDWFRTLFRGEPLKTLFSTADWRDADLLRQAIDGTKGV
jgi:hypothetical protein